MEKNYFIRNDKAYLIIIAILIGSIFAFGHFYAGSILLVLYIIFLIYNIKVIKNKNGEWKKILEDFSVKIDVSTRNILTNIPLPLTIINGKGNILWYNQKFFNILNQNEILGNKINDIVTEINIEDILDKNKKELNYVKIEEKYYNIFINIKGNKEAINNKNKTIFLYFYDVTQEVELRKEIKQEKEVIILIEVDNLDEVIKTTQEDKVLLLSAEIERTLKTYAQNLNAMITKYSTSKYIMLANARIMKEEMKKNFEILDEMRDIDLGNELTVTLSIGAGYGGNTPLENYNFAVSAKELALGRGGDQVVVKNKDKIKFYGGKTKEVAKRTKVRVRVVGHALVDIINKSSNVFIMGHSNPDIDSIGAAIGLNIVSKYLGKEAYIILDEINTGIEKAIKKIKHEGLYNELFITKEQYLNKFNRNSLLILVDVNSKSYVQDLQVLQSIDRIVIIDHHRKSTDSIEGSLVEYIEPYASSTCELITEMLQYMMDNPKKHINPIYAEMLLAGIYVDTKNFYFKTGVRTFEAAAYLKQIGADILEVKKMFLHDLETILKKYKIMSLSTIENNICIAICPPEIQDTVLAAQVSDELLNITGIQASFVLVKIKNEVFISGRSNGDINVQLILEELGGGGHLNIAGARLNEVSINEARDKLKIAIDKYLMEGEK